MSGLEILSILPTATIQDRGRVGFLRFGVTSSGAMDGYALAEGQALLGNGPDDAAIEFAEFGGRFRATDMMSVALSGAEMQARLNGVECGWRQVVTLAPGDVLDIGAAREGVYGYLHVPGGFLTETVLGARATHLRAGFGHVLAVGQTLMAGDGQRQVARAGLRCPAYFDQRVIRALWGPQSHYFTDAERQRFAKAHFTVTKMRDRMGIRIRPDIGPIHAELGLSIASDAISPGDIQITGDGLPAVLLADRGPTGGYPRIATLASVDLAVLAQIPTGQEFTLELVSRAEAVDLLADYRADIKGLLGRVDPLIRDPRQMSDLLAYNLIDGMIAGGPDDGEQG